MKTTQQTLTNLLLSFVLLFGTFNGFSQIYNMPGGTINTCSGTSYDSGGSGSDYSSDEDVTTTFCSNTGDCISLNFTSFNIESGWDFLYIYDGPTTGSTLIGTYTGTTSPGTVFSSTGCITLRFTSDGSITRPGWDATISCAPCIYIHPTVGINNEYVGSCLVADCGPAGYSDDGGPGGNYSNDINNIYRVFCPNTAGNCMSVTFTSFDVETGWDYLMIGNGPTQNSTLFTTPPANASGQISGTPATPFSYTSTDASGCLTFRFYSDFMITRPGWTAVLQCVPCAGGPNGTDNNDCQTQTAICSNTNITSASTGPGISAEGCTGSDCPAGGENHTNWYKFVAATTGNLSLTITPNVSTGDYDFAIYGPNVTCGALGSPIRCTDSGLTGNTGLDNGSFDNTEDVTGDSWLAELNVIAGEEYFLVVDEWSPTSAGGYTLSWAGSTASLDCIVLPVELSEFNTEYNPELGVVDVFWATESERNNDYFLVERSVNGTDYEVINKVKGAGNTQYETQYYVEDPNPFVGVNYYRLKQVDFDGEFKYSEVRSVNILNDTYDLMSVFPNPAENVTEVIFNSYDNNGAMLKLVKMDGKIIINTPIETTRGANHIKVDLSQQESGIYFVVVVTDKKVFTEKLVIR